VADLTFELYAKYWTPTQQSRIAARLGTWATNNGLTYDTRNIVQNTKPERHTITFIGVNKTVVFDQDYLKALVGA